MAKEKLDDREAVGGGADIVKKDKIKKQGIGSLDLEKAEQMEAILECAKAAPQLVGLSDDQKEVAIEIVRDMFSRFPTLDFPKTNPDGSIEMDLMLGGKIKVGVPRGEQMMSAEREMDLVNEKGDRDILLPVYVLSACSEIDGAPCTIFDIKEKLSGRDYKTLLNYFRSINLL